MNFKMGWRWWHKRSNCGICVHSYYRWHFPRTIKHFQWNAILRRITNRINTTRKREKKGKRIREFPFVIGNYYYLVESNLNFMQTNKNCPKIDKISKAKRKRTNEIKNRQWNQSFLGYSPLDLDNNGLRTVWYYLELVGPITVVKWNPNRLILQRPYLFDSDQPSKDFHQLMTLSQWKWKWNWIRTKSVLRSHSGSNIWMKSILLQMTMLMIEIHYWPCVLCFTAVYLIPKWIKSKPHFTSHCRNEK